MVEAIELKPGGYVNLFFFYLKRQRNREIGRKTEIFHLLVHTLAGARTQEPKIQYKSPMQVTGIFIAMISHYLVLSQGTHQMEAGCREGLGIELGTLVWDMGILTVSSPAVQIKSRNSERKQQKLTKQKHNRKEQTKCLFFANTNKTDKPKANA